jgi:hypothetical protein
LVCELHQELSGHVVGVVHLGGDLLLAIEVNLKNHAGNVLPVRVWRTEMANFNVLVNKVLKTLHFWVKMFYNMEK